MCWKVIKTKQLLENSVNLLDVTYAAGLTSPGRLYDLFVTCEAGEGLTITYGFHASPFGECMLATTDRGICGFYFVKEGNRNHIFSELKYFWKNAEFGSYGGGPARKKAILGWEAAHSGMHA
jgi:AraC family transcriptional regulator of adaptative response/methylated-DNA-[protein]-cysteine methyltransferase